MSDDTKIWHDYTLDVRVKTQTKPKAQTKKSSVKPLKSGTDKVVLRQAAAEVPVTLINIKSSEEKALGVEHRLERKREKALREGDVVIEAKLDLHGLTQVTAFDALARFMRRAVADRLRHILVVTGKGSGGAGVLRMHLKIWLSQLPEAQSILTIRPAALRHGGSGAVYIILRR